MALRCLCFGHKTFWLSPCCPWFLFLNERVHMLKERALFHSLAGGHCMHSRGWKITLMLTQPKGGLDFQQKMHIGLFLLKGWELAANCVKKAPELITSIFVCHTSHIVCLGRQNCSKGISVLHFSLVLKKETQTTHQWLLNLILVWLQIKS